MVNRYDGGSGGGVVEHVNDLPANAGANDIGLGVAVNVNVSNLANAPAATTAAQNLAVTLAKTLAALNDLPPNTPINWAGNTYTAAQVSSILQNTKFIMSDASNFGNGGVGAAAYNPNGPHTDTLDFRFFDGDLTNSGDRDYAAPYYSNGQGLTGILLHEAGHLTAVGADFDNRNHIYYLKENPRDTTYSQFPNSEYWSNNEAFANDFAIAAAGAMNIDISQISSGWLSGSIDPAQIYYDHMGF